MSSVALHMMMLASVAPVLSLYALTFGVGEWAAGLIVTIFGIGRLLVDVPAGILADRVGRRLLLFGGPLIAAAASLGAALSDAYWPLLGFRFLQGVGSGVYMTVAAVVCADISTPQTRTRVMALYQSALLLGAGLGPAIGGYLAVPFGLGAPFWMSMGAGILAAASASFVPTHGAVRPGCATLGGELRELGSALVFAPLAAALAINMLVFFTRSGGQWTVLPLLASDRFGFEVLNRAGFAGDRLL